MSEPFDRALRAAARRSRPAGVCPDAAVLASYADNGLSADERRLVEAHAADCARCLEHLALVGAVSLDREAPEPSRSWLVRWGWLVPVATAALVVAVWVRLPEQKAAEDASAAFGAKQTAPVALHEQERSSAAAASEDSDAARNQASRVAAKAARTATPARQAAAEPKVDELAPLERRDSARRKAASVPPAEAVPPAAPVTQEQTLESGREEAQDLRLGAATGKVAAPPAAAAAAPTLSDAMKKQLRAQTLASRETVRARGNRIEQSKDGGATWRSLLSEPQSTFTAVGCAPDGPCWIGTADGQVLRRTPDGFERSALPVRARVASIAAEGPLTALATLDGGQRFRTTDGGTTWRPLP